MIRRAQIMADLSQKWGFVEKLFYYLIKSKCQLRLFRFISCKPFQLVSVFKSTSQLLTWHLEWTSVKINHKLLSNHTIPNVAILKSATTSGAGGPWKGPGPPPLVTADF